MKRWEKFNEDFDQNQSIEEQTVNVYTRNVLDRIEHMPDCGSLVEAAEVLPLMKMYKTAKAYLCEEIEALKDVGIK